ncbi:hypothetical protein SAY87_016629 [Trapa incisa]|uniref:Uncharacterized protein n=1 Tax=Trapa incisa TaxID=236973 RepID=A0AAN7L1J6_9MYRT|nr:hypothetical protein SAY87_016629 [Trapa incisa]
MGRHNWTVNWAGTETTSLGKKKTTTTSSIVRPFSPSSIRSIPISGEIAARMKKPWIEVAPSLIGLPRKSSVCPSLETIVEERAEDCCEEHDDQRH